MTVDIIIPTYKPDETLCLLLHKLQGQTFVVHRVIILNTEEELWNQATAAYPIEQVLKELPCEYEVFHIAKKDFDHGGTRQFGAEHSDADVMVFMTQDAVPADEFLVEKLVESLLLKEDQVSARVQQNAMEVEGTEKSAKGDCLVAVAYARQLPKNDCHIVEQYTRQFNYPEQSRVKTKADIPTLGIKTFFCSDVCAAYRRDLFEALGGFESPVIFNEDMFFAANAIEHGYPYANLTDHRWSTLLAQYLPEFIYASSEKDLDHSIRKLAAEINDSHGGLEFPNHAPRLYGLPLGLTQTTDGKLVVESTALKQIERGSVILAVNDKPISEIIDNYRSILPSSNEHGLLRNVSFRLFVTSENEMKVTVENQGQSHEYTIPMQSFERASFKGRKSPSDYGLDARKILYVDAGIMGLPELDQMMKTNLNAKGIILDMRKYPRWDIMEVLGKYLYPQPTTFMWYSINSKKFPGNFGLDIIGKIGFKENPDYFKGKIAILVSEMTQSFGELMSVAYRVAPKSAVIGTQTAGANGHVGYLYLPRGIKFTYTMAGAFYPEWKLNQRDGVTIDIPVEQTVEDIAAGEDMWIRKAIEYIESKR